MSSTCIYCHRRLWPWQRRGWRIGLGRWHGRCYRENER
jgi:hypothetical protein